MASNFDSVVRHACWKWMLHDGRRFLHGFPRLPYPVNMKYVTVSGVIGVTYYRLIGKHALGISSSQCT